MKVIYKREKDFIKIRKILNEWDPIDVADDIDEEYDSINIAVYSAYKRFGNTESIKKAIIKYLVKSMGSDEYLVSTDKSIEEIAKNIKKILDEK